VIIAEIGQNYMDNIHLAHTMLAMAHGAGADLVKFQLFDYEKLYTDHKIPKCELSKEQAFGLFEHGKTTGIEVFFSVFDTERVGWCEEIGVKRYKIACGMNNYDVWDAIQATKKEMIVSFSLPWAGGMGFTKNLYCVPKYPTLPSQLHFDKVDFTIMSGFSDHTIGLDAAKIALSRGAKIIEKHFCLNHSIGVDAAWSMDSEELKELKRWETVCKEVL
jgi:sialic acid synthase SpsE